MSDKNNINKAKIIDDIISDKGTFVMSKKSVKWIIGILISCTLSILGVAWGFNSKLDDKIDRNHSIVMEEFEELRKEEVKPNTIKIYELDGIVGILLDRTNSKNHMINIIDNRPLELLNTRDSLPGLPGE